MKTKLILLAVVGLLASCTVEMNPDGSKSVIVDPATTTEIVRVLSEK